MVILDTMVFAYALLGVPRFRTEAAAVIEAAEAIAAPDSLFAELSNVCWRWVADGFGEPEDGVGALRDAESLVDMVVPTATLAVRALELSVGANHPAYDTLFVALGERLGVPVVTYDKKFLKKFSAQTLRPKQFVSNNPQSSANAPE